MSAWRKACGCDRATATTGRIIFGGRVYPVGNLTTTHAAVERRGPSVLHPGPVCDRCDTPWTATAATTEPHAAPPPIDSVPHISPTDEGVQG
jgi:hypothetical protein